MSVIGVDFGGTRIKVGLVNGGCVSDLNVFASPADRSLGGILDYLEMLFREMVNAAKTPVEAMVWALPCVVAADGRTISKTFGKYDDCAHLPLIKWARERFGVSLILENDARAAAIGEWIFGAGKGTENMVAITLGTGIGSAVIADGKPLSGSRGYAGNLGGHLRLPDSERPCICGRLGCVEAEVATWALPMIAAESPLFSSSKLSQLECIDYLAVFSLAEENDPLAVGLRDRAIRCWAWLIDEMALLYDPEMTVIGGGIMAGGETILSHLRANLDSRMRLKQAELGDAAALAGCENIIRKHLS